MATSQNGWPVIDSYSSRYLTSVPKIIGKVRADGGVAQLFTHLILWFDANIEDVDQGRDDWGYNYRPIRGQSTGFSNHASGTAIDLNAQQHPRGKVNTFSAAQRAAIRKQLRDVYKGTIRWGGDYDTRISKRDDMHFEIDASSSEIAAVLKDLQGGDIDVVPVGKVEHPTGAVKPKLQHGWTRAQVNNIIRAMNRMGLDAGVEDGDYGPMLTAAVRAFQKQHGLVQDGVYGPKTQAVYLLNRKIQQALRKQGYTKQTVDGYIGAQTTANVRDFQRRTGLVVDGDPGPITQKRLGI